jgi:hypothetical protein
VKSDAYGIFFESLTETRGVKTVARTTGARTTLDAAMVEDHHHRPNPDATMEAITTVELGEEEEDAV